MIFTRNLFTVLICATVINFFACAQQPPVFFSDQKVDKLTQDALENNVVNAAVVDVAVLKKQKIFLGAVKKIVAGMVWIATVDFVIDYLIDRKDIGVLGDLCIKTVYMIPALLRTFAHDLDKEREHIRDSERQRIYENRFKRLEAKCEGLQRDFDQTLKEFAGSKGGSPLLI